MTVPVPLCGVPAARCAPHRAARRALLRHRFFGAAAGLRPDRGPAPSLTNLRLDQKTALAERRKAVDAIRDSLEHLHTAQYPGFLAAAFEPVAAQLTATEPQFEKDSELQLLRHAALEVLSRLPASEALKPYASKLCDVCLAVSQSA